MFDPEREQAQDTHRVHTIQHIIMPTILLKSFSWYEIACTGSLIMFWRLVTWVG